MEPGEFLGKIKLGDFRYLAKAISIVENDLPGSKDLLTSLSFSDIPVIGITGPPGAGKSTLVNGLITYYTRQNKRLGIIAIDPTSPFNFGSILGDRIRMSEHFNNPNVFIRSLATRGALGGLSVKTIEVCDVMRASNFDMIIVETAGVGQSEVEIVGLADITVLVLVPEAGDEVQSMKSGVMEIADIYVVNKGDRPGADLFYKNLLQLIHEQKHKSPATKVVKCVATQEEGVGELARAIEEYNRAASHSKRAYLLTEKAYKLIQDCKMSGIDKKDLLKKITEKSAEKDFNLYKFVEAYC